eukprot:6553060-Heterocapsa_arctica.AAC.1
MRTGRGAFALGIRGAAPPIAAPLWRQSCMATPGPRLGPHLHRRVLPAHSLPRGSPRPWVGVPHTLPSLLPAHGRDIW